MFASGLIVSKVKKQPASQAGFALVGVLIMALVIGIMAAAVAPLFSTMVRSEREKALRYRLSCIRRAISRYQEKYRKYPSSLEELVKEKFLRQLYPDPMTGRFDWKQILGKGLGIMDVKSASTNEALGPPPKTKNQKEKIKKDEKNTYDKW